MPRIKRYWALVPKSDGSGDIEIQPWDDRLPHDITTFGFYRRKRAAEDAVHRLHKTRHLRCSVCYALLSTHPRQQACSPHAKKPRAEQS